jgi:hypothetical protein
MVIRTRDGRFEAQVFSLFGGHGTYKYIVYRLWKDGRKRAVARRNGMACLSTAIGRARYALRRLRENT